MCFSSPKAPSAPTPTPPPPPAPIPTPDETSPQSAEENRRSRLDRLRAGLASTIRTSPTGVNESNFAPFKMYGNKGLGV